MATAPVSAQLDTLATLPVAFNGALGESSLHVCSCWCPAQRQLAFRIMWIARGPCACRTPSCLALLHAHQCSAAPANLPATLTDPNFTHFALCCSLPHSHASRNFVLRDQVSCF
jgi:hypothetical protein